MSQVSVPLDATSAARVHMLRVGKVWQSQGQVNRALDLYTRIVQRYPNSEEAREALALVLGLAQGFETEGRCQLALGVYERLERLS